MTASLSEGAQHLVVASSADPLPFHTSGAVIFGIPSIAYRLDSKEPLVDRPDFLSRPNWPRHPTGARNG